MLSNLVETLAKTFDRQVDILDIKHIAWSTNANTPPPGKYEIGDPNLMLWSLLFDEVKVKVIVDDFRLWSNLTTDKTTKFTEKSFFYTKLDFTPSPLGPSRNIEDFV